MLFLRQLVSANNGLAIFIKSESSSGTREYDNTSLKPFSTKPFLNLVSDNCLLLSLPGFIGLGRFKSNLSYPTNLAISSIKSISLIKSFDLLGIT